MKKPIMYIPVILFIILLLLITFYKSTAFNQYWFFKFPENSEKFGQLGDFFGGVLNPLISILGFGLAFHIYSSDKEKENENKQKSNFLKLYEGYSRLLDKNELNKFIAQNEGNKEVETFLTNMLCTKNCVDINVKSAKKLHHYLNFNEFAPLMRTAYHLLKSELEKEGDQKWTNIRIFRAQLCENELILMALNILIDPEGSIGLSKVALKSGLFKHLKHEKLKLILEQRIPKPLPNESYSFFDLKLIQKNYGNKKVL